MFILLVSVVICITIIIIIIIITALPRGVPVSPRALTCCDGREQVLARRPSIV